jgi:hypothetical protein
MAQLAYPECPTGMRLHTFSDPNFNMLAPRARAYLYMQQATYTIRQVLEHRKSITHNKHAPFNVMSLPECPYYFDEQSRCLLPDLRQCGDLSGILTGDIQQNIFDVYDYQIVKNPMANDKNKEFIEPITLSYYAVVRVRPQPQARDDDDSSSDEEVDSLPQSRLDNVLLVSVCKFPNDVPQTVAPVFIFYLPNPTTDTVNELFRTLTKTLAGINRTYTDPTTRTHLPPSSPDVTSPRSLSQPPLDLKRKQEDEPPPSKKIIRLSIPVLTPFQVIWQGIQLQEQLCGIFL